MQSIPSSELIINGDGSVFHLHIRPDELADRIILVGDPARVEVVAALFDSIQFRNANREFVSVTGIYKGKNMTVLSTGIGTDNIDIVMTELDALVNVDFTTRTVNQAKKKLHIVRLGTSGALQPDLSVGDYVLAEVSVGFDGLLNFYARRNEVCDLGAEKEFVNHTQWNLSWPAPYFIHSSPFLNELFGKKVQRGITVSAPGFYGPQGRMVRLLPIEPKINSKLESFRYGHLRIMNYEMESSALAGLAALLGHEATTVCTIIAQRIKGNSNPDYHPQLLRMIEMTLEKLGSF